MYQSPAKNFTLWLLLSSLASLIFTQTSYYVNQNNPAASPDGSLDRPFNSIEQAIQKLGAGNFQLYLLGNSVIIGSTIDILPSSQYIVKPYSLPEGTTHFLLNLDENGFINLNATLSLEQVQINELFVAKSSPAIALGSNGVLNLNNVLFKDITFPNPYYIFIQKASYDFPGEVNIIDSEFSNLENIVLLLSATKLTITNTIFSELRAINAGFVFMDGLFPDQVPTVTNVTIQNSRFGEVLENEAYGFLNLFALTEVLFDGLVLKNVTIAKSYAFFCITFDDDGSLPTVTLKNIWLENVIEDPNPVGFPGFGGLVFQVLASANVVVQNFTVINAQIQEYTVLEVQGQPLTPTGYPTVTMSDVVVQDSVNPYFYIFQCDQASLERITLEGNKYFDVDFADPLFKFQESREIIFQGLSGKNNVGPLTEFLNVLNITLLDWDLTDLKTSQTLSSQRQITINMERQYKTDKPWETYEFESVTTFQNIHINGLTDVDGINSMKESNDTYLIRIIFDYGQVYIKDSKLSNIEMGGIIVSYAKYLSIDNMIYDFDPSTPLRDVAWHRMLQILELAELYITNSQFLDHKNFGLLSFYNIYRSSEREEILQSNLYFENIVVNNNVVPTDDQEDRFTSLFMTRSPVNPVKITFKNCHFKGNTVLKGVILNDESAKIDVDLIGNTFDSNYALQAGAVFTSDTMQNQYNVLNIFDNTFINNTCLGNGGVFYFDSTKHQITSQNNKYIDNSVKGSGGVGYAMRANFVFSETTGFYSGNSAGNFGGSWFLSIVRQPQKQPQTTFTDTRFEKSSASREGGAIYLATGDLSLQNCRFKESKAEIAGGDIRVITAASLLMSQSQSTSSDSPQGSFLFADAIVDDIITLQNVEVMNTYPTQLDSTLIALGAGSLIMSDSSIHDISSSLFDVNSASITFIRTLISDITCYTMRPFCILQGLDSFFALQDSQFTDVTSNRDLIVIQNPLLNTNININNIQMLNIKRREDTPTEIFGLVLRHSGNVNIYDSTFRQLTTSSIKVQNSTINLLNTIFSNADSSRLLQGYVPSKSNNLAPRFLVLDSSNSKISDSSFTQNSLNSQQNGGAIAILGSKGSHEILRCIFQDNTGFDGGAVIVQGVIESFSISDSQFNNNKASRYGGGLYLENSEENLAMPVLTRVTFNGNQAWSGAAVDVMNYPVLIQDAEFDGNSASIGGSITSYCLKTQIISLYRNKFTSNYADVGAVLMSVGDMNYKYYNTTFTGNKAKYGGDIATKPYTLSVAIYEVPESFLYLGDVSLDSVLSDYQTQLIYDSTNPSLQNPITMKTGITPNYVFQFTVVDELNHPFWNIGEMDITIDQKVTTKATSISDSISLFGVTSFKIKQATGNVFKSFLLRGVIGSQTTLTASVKILDAVIGNYYELPPVEWPVIIGSCSYGETYDPINFVCNPCPENSYSFADPFSTTTCQVCFDTAVCLGGNVLYPKEGYWRINKLSDNFIQCLNTASCPGGLNDQGTNISLTGFCAQGHEGIGCGSCSPGYVKSGGDNQCLKCSADVGTHIRFFAFFILQIALTVFTVRSHMKVANLTEKERENRNLQASLVKVLIDFLHVLNLALAFNINWPKVLNNYLDYTSEVTPSSKDIFSIDCIISAARGNENIFFIKLLITIIQPLFFIIVGLIVWLIIFKVTKRRVRGNDGFTEKVILTSSIIVYILQPDVLKQTFQIFNCRNFGPTSDKRYYLIEDTSIQCWGPLHISWILGLAIPSLLLWLITPCCMILSLLKRRDLAESEEFRKKYGFLFEKFRPSTFFWEIVILSRKVVLIILAVFLTFTYLQAYLSFFTLIIAFLLQRTFKPYTRKVINQAELISLYSSAGIMYTGLFFVREDIYQPMVPLLLVVDVISGVVFFGYCLYILKKVMKQKLIFLREKLDRIIDNDQFKWKKIRNWYRHIRKCLESKPKLKKKKTKDLPEHAKGETIPNTGSAGRQSDQEVISSAEVGPEMIKASENEVEPTIGAKSNGENIETIQEDKELHRPRLPSISLEMDVDEKEGDNFNVDSKVVRYPSIVLSRGLSMSSLNGPLLKATKSSIQGNN